MSGHPLSQERTKIGILGGGAWGTALSIHCARMGHDTLLWAREQEVCDGINGEAKENTVYFKVWLALRLNDLQDNTTCIV